MEPADQLRAPLGPSRPTSSPSATSRSTPAEGLRAAVALAHGVRARAGVGTASDGTLPPMPGLQEEAVALLGQLIRFDTVNPPGDERPAQELLAGLLRGAPASR